MASKQKAEITAKRYGKNFVVVIKDDGKEEKLSRVTTPEEAEEAKRLIDMYKKMKRKGDLVAIKDFMQPKKTIEEEKKVRAKGVKKAIEKNKKKLEENPEVEPEPKDLATQVEEALLRKDIPEDQLERLRKLLEVKKEEVKTERPATYTSNPVRRTPEH